MSVHVNLIVRAYVFSYNMSVGISQPVITKMIYSCIIVIKQRILITYLIQNTWSIRYGHYFFAFILRYIFMRSYKIISIIIQNPSIVLDIN